MIMVTPIGTTTIGDGQEPEAELEREYAEDGTPLIGRWSLEMCEEWARYAEAGDQPYNSHLLAALRAVDLLRAELAEAREDAHRTAAERDAARAEVDDAGLLIAQHEARIASQLNFIGRRGEKLREARADLAALRTAVAAIADDAERVARKWSGPGQLAFVQDLHARLRTALGGPTTGDGS